MEVMPGAIEHDKASETVTLSDMNVQQPADISPNELQALKKKQKYYSEVAWFDADHRRNEDYNNNNNNNNNGSKLLDHRERSVFWHEDKLHLIDQKEIQTIPSYFSDNIWF